MAHGGGPSGEPLDLFADYFRYMRARGFASGTRWARFAVARDWWAHVGGDLSGATHRDVERWATSKNLTAGSTRNLYVNLRAFYRWARREGHVTSDPTELVDPPSVPRRLPRPAPEVDIARVLAVSAPIVRTLVALMACGGLRCVECSRLDWVDVDLEAGTVIVNGKGSKERLIDLSSDVLHALREHRAASGRRAGAVFVGPTGRRMSPARVSQVVARTFAALGLTTRAHQLRHRCATLALQQPGADLLDVRDLLGHSSVSTTQIYTAVVPGRTAKTSRALRLPAAAVGV